MSHVEYQPQSSLADFELLAEVSQLLTFVDLDRVLERVIDLSARAVGADKASLFLHHQERDTWQRLLITRKLNPSDTTKVVERVIDQGLAGWVMRNRQGTIVGDTEQDDRWVKFSNDTNVVRSAMCLPLMQNDEVLAVITLVHNAPNHFNEHHLRLLTIVANQITVAIRNAQLFNRMLEQQQQLVATLQAIPDIFLVVSDNGRILMLNGTAAHMLGADEQQDLIGEPFDQLLYVDSALEPLQAVMADPPSVGQTVTFETRSERQRSDFVVTVSRWENAFGGTAGSVIIMRDVTTLRDLNRFKGDMLKMASHDLRSPLALIVGYTDLISLDIAPDAPAQSYIDAVKRSTRRMNILLDDLLRVEEIRSSPDELLRPTNFPDLVERTLEGLSLLSAPKGQTMDSDILLGEMPPLTIDPALIREAMDNLTSNAVKYTPEGGHIRVISYYDDRRVYFIVEDNGRGIAPEDINRIFDWGYRAKQLADEPAIDGKGFGLNMVKTVLERHGGEVWVESQPNVGSRFGFWLPLA